MENKKSSRKWLWTLLGLIVAALVVFAIWQAVDNDESSEPANNQSTTTQTENAEPESEENGNMLERIVNDPAQYYGQQVNVRGEIQDIYDQRVFRISDQALGDELLVLTSTALTDRQLEEAAPLFEDNADVRIQGTLRQLTIADVEREFGLDFPEDFEVEYSSRPLLVAANFTFSDTNAVFDFTEGPTAEGAENNSPEITDTIITDIP